MTAGLMSQAHTDTDVRFAGRRFNLLGSFALLSFIVILASGAVSAALISDFLARHLLERDTVDAQHFLQSIFDAKGTLNLSATQSIDPDPVKPFDLNYIAAMPNVLRANYYSPDWRIIWTTSRNLLGKQFPNEELERALRGQVVFEVKELNERDKAEHVQFEGNVHALENYIPIWDHARSRVIGVVEIYKSPTDLFASIEEARKLVWTSAALAGLMLYVSLFWIVFYANRLIHRQHTKLIEAETMAAVGEMASAVAHSIRNPLAAIRSSAELAFETSNEAVTRETAEDVIAEADRIEQWVRELLIFSQPGSASFEPLHLQSVIDACLAGFHRCLLRQHVALHVGLPADLPPIYGDERLLMQMFNSVIANAVEAMLEGGTLTVHGAHTDAHTVVISIADTGYGIPRERLRRLFEMRTTTKRGGLGVGMSLVKRIADRHGAIITVSSDPGQGTTVHLSFSTEVRS